MILTQPDLCAADRFQDAPPPEVAVVDELTRLRYAVETAGLATWDFDPETGAVSRSDRLDEIFGYERPLPTWSYEVFRRHLLSEDAEEVEARITVAVERREDMNFEYRIRRADGGLRWVEVRGRPVETGGRLRYVGILADISDRKRAEAALRESERRFRVLADSMPQMVWSTLPNGDHDYFNDRWYDFTGVPRGATDGTGWNGVFHPEDRDRAWSRWRRSLETGEPYEIEYRLRHRSGAFRWVLGRAVPLRDEAGRIERWFGTCTDIEDLKAAEERIELALSAGGVVGTWVWIVPEDRVVADPRFARLFSVDEGEAMAGAPLEKFVRMIHPQDRPQVDAAIRTAVESAAPYRCEYRVLQPDGSFRWVDVRGRCERDAEGRPFRFPGTAVDVTERRRAEEARDLVTRELGHRIKNIFAVVGSLITLSARNEPALKPYAQALRSRVDSLATAQNYVRPHSPESRAALGQQTLQGLVRLLMEPYAAEDETRVSIEGEDSPIGPDAAVALALILHELATNAVKYGALSAPYGRIAVAGDSDGDDYVLTWREIGGPRIAETPTREGFGTLMATRAARGQLSGRLIPEWHPEGLRVRLVLPRAGLER